MVHADSLSLRHICSVLRSCLFIQFLKMLLNISERLLDSDYELNPKTYCTKVGTHNNYYMKHKVSSEVYFTNHTNAHT